MKSIVVVLCLSVFGLAGAHAEPAPKCGDARNQEVVKHVSPGQKFDDIVAYLEGANVPYFLSSRLGKTVSLQLIRDQGYAAFGPLEITVRSDDGGGVMSMGAAIEMLTIDFDKKGILAREYCMTYSTGT